MIDVSRSLISRFLSTAPSLGQLVRPSVGVSPVRPGPAPSGGPAQPGSTFTAMQLPATLTIRTSTPAPGERDT